LNGVLIVYFRFRRLKIAAGGDDKNDKRPSPRAALCRESAAMSTPVPAGDLLNQIWSDANGLL
jgi:hypothetical protein